MQIGRRIYYELSTGNVILDTGERLGDVIETTTEQDRASYTALSERVPSTVGCLRLEYGEFAQNFAANNGYRVDISGETPSLLFSYPNSEISESLMVYHPPQSRELVEPDRVLEPSSARHSLCIGNVTIRPMFQIRVIANACITRFSNGESGITDIVDSYGMSQEDSDLVLAEIYASRPDIELEDQASST